MVKYRVHLTYTFAISKYMSIEKIIPDYALLLNLLINYLLMKLCNSTEMFNMTPEFRGSHLPIHKSAHVIMKGIL